MKRALAIVLVVAAVLWVRRLGETLPAALPATSLALGLTLVMAMVTGEVLRRFKLPRLTGYLLFGVLIGPYLANLITEPMARQLQTINALATALIAFIAGLTLNFERLERNVNGVTRLLAAILGVAAVGLFAVLWLAWPWLPVAPEADGLAKIAMVAPFVVIMLSFSPTVTAAVISETGARGRFSELILAIVVLADAVVLVMFSLTVQFGHGVFSESGGADVNVLIRLAWAIGGAVAFGCLIGALFALYLRYVAKELTLVLLGVCAVLAQVGATQRFEPMLAALAAGMVIQNVAPPQGDALKMAIQRGALPILVVFFVGIGTSLEVGALMQIGVVALALTVARIGVIRLGVVAGLRASGISREAGGYLWTGLISQAGITLGLAAVLAMEFPTWGVRLQTLLVALIAIDELVGPALFRVGLARAGETDGGTRRPLIVVSNREPYLHNYDSAGGIVVSHATGGVAVALDALMRERGGTWIAHGDGSADRAVVDVHDQISVPPESPSYQLRRLWLGREEHMAYYGGFANEGLWPLCHLVDVRPQFRSEDWAAYQAVNDRFAGAIDRELPTPDTPVFIQDYHLALVAQRLRARRPNVRTALFWHIPWPYPDRLRICPWSREILQGLLANDLLAFQVERDRRNFLLAIEEGLDAEIEADGESVRLGRPRHHGHRRADRRGLRPDPGGGARSRSRSRAAPAAGRLRPARRDSGARSRPAGLHERHSRAAGGAGPDLHAPPRAARPHDLRPDWRAVAFGARQLQRPGVGDRSEGRRHQRPPRAARPAAAALLSQGRVDAAESRGALSPRAHLRRQLAARRDEPGREGVRGGTRR